MTPPSGTSGSHMRAVIALLLAGLSGWILLRELRREPHLPAAAEASRPALEAELDAELDATFPASDPPTITSPPGRLARPQRD